MFSCIRKNSKVIPEKTYKKVVYNDSNCPYCNSNNSLPLTDDGGSLSQCLTCNKTFRKFKYIEETNIKKDNYIDFINKNNKNVFI